MNSARVRQDAEMFASANEEIRDRAEQFGFTGAVPFLCECSSVECMEPVQLALPTYRELRAHGERFILRPGHDDPRVERIVGSAADYTLVEKLS